MEKTPQNITPEENFPQIETEGVNIESAEDLIAKMSEKLEAGTLDDTDHGELKAMDTNLTELQDTVDAPEIRQALAKIRALKATLH